MKPAWLLVGLLWVIALLNYLDRQVINSLFPLLRSELGLSDTQLGLTGALFLWTYAFFSPLAGWATSRFGHRRVILWSLMAWSAITGVTGFSKDFATLAATRVGMGVTEAFYIPAALALIAVRHPDSTRSRAIALHQSGIYVGIVLGGAGGGYLGEYYGWRSAFYLLGIVGIVYGVFLTSRLDASMPTDAPIVQSNFIGDAFAVLVAPGFKAVLAVFAIVSLANWMVYTWLPLYLYDRFQLSLTASGFSAAALIQGPGLLGIAAGAWLADHFGVRFSRGRILTQCGGLLIAAPCLFLSGWVATVPLLFAALFFYGLGRGVYDCNAMPVLCDLVPPSQLATGYGLLNFAGTLMGGISAYWAGAMRAQIGLDGAMRFASFLVLAGIVLLLTVRAKPSTAR